jgi:uncharacterized membrane protein
VFRVLTFLLLLLLCSSLVQAQQDQTGTGYLEGRITSISTATNTAVVRLDNGLIVTADLGQPFSEDSVMPAFKPGQQVELYYAPGPDGSVQYAVSDWVRRPALLLLTGLFLIVSVLVARFKGLRAFVATGASLAIIIAFIVPGILQGYNPFLVALAGVGGILILAIYFVHGLNWSTTAALAGTYSAILVTMLLGVIFTRLAFLTGFGTEDGMLISIYASQVNLRGLLLAGLLIGALGALTDITIVQASVVRELAHTDPTLGLRELYRLGMNVGLDHVGSLINTLVLAYAGSALPLLVLLYLNDLSFAQTLNLEMVAVEVVHTLVGSIGLIVAVPLTTFLAALLFRGDRLPVTPGELDHGHHH